VQTLYELLGALPEDDADDLRAAFRKAVKASHPDNNPDDLEAPQRFRRIVRANTILSDDRQRATYDLLLAEARQERVLDPERRTFSEPRTRMPGVISSMVIASVSIGAFLLLERVLTNSVIAEQVREMPVQTAALIAPSSDMAGLAGEQIAREKPPVASELEIPDPIKEPANPLALATMQAASVIPATSETHTSETTHSETHTSETLPSRPKVKDANYYRERGTLAYRNGDFLLALVDFDLAISLDPDSLDTYVDRAIVFRRMGDMKRAMADIAKAKHIDDTKPQ
jgi:tetratricopeptide (TPR) repeat protein